MKLLKHSQASIVEVCDCISNFISNFYNGCNYLSMLGKGAPKERFRLHPDLSHLIADVEKWWKIRYFYVTPINYLRERVKYMANFAHWHQNGLTSIPAWISNHMPNKVWDEISYPFPNLNGESVEDWKWISNFIPHLLMDVIIYPWWDGS